MTSAMWGIVIGIAAIITFSLHRSRLRATERVAAPSHVVATPRGPATPKAGVSPASTSAL
jgi:hypothetical protein